jgi:hypothetical protein
MAVPAWQTSLAVMRELQRCDASTVMKRLQQVFMTIIAEKPGLQIKI